MAHKKEKHEKHEKKEESHSHHAKMAKHHLSMLHHMAKSKNPMKEPRTNKDAYGPLKKAGEPHDINKDTMTKIARKQDKYR